MIIRSGWTSRIAPLCVFIVALALCACDGGSGSDVNNAQEPWENQIQDLWVYEQIVAVAPGEAPVELGDVIVDGLGDDSDGEVELVDGAVFYIYDELDPHIVDADGEVRDEIKATGGLIEYEGERVPAVLATPDIGGKGAVGFNDEVRFDLTFLGENLVEPGDALIYDFAFLQTHAAPDKETYEAEEGLDDVELLAHRMAEERVGFAGEETDDGVDVHLYTGQVGVAVEGSTQASGGAKAQDMIDGMVDGLEGCGGGLKCVSDFFDSFGEGAKDSWDQAWDNAPENDPDQPNDDDGFELCLTDDCGDSWGDPHLNTFDGSSYDVMAAGEFVLVRNDDIEIQKRMQIWEDNSSITAGTAFAIQIGDERITLDTEAPEGEELKINGEAVDIDEIKTEGWTSGDVKLTHNADTLQLEGANHYITLLGIEEHGARDIYIQLDPDDPRGEGLLGHVSGISDDDLTSRGGELYEGSTRDPDFYETFVDSWRVTDDESLFDYREGRDTDHYTDRSIPENILGVDDLDDEMRAWAEEICKAAGVTVEEALRHCIYDVGFSQDPTLANASKSSESADKIREGELHPTRAAQRGLVDPDDHEVGSELADGHLDEAEGRILWTFEGDTTEPKSHPDLVDVSQVEDPNQLPTFEVTDSYGYPNDPVLRFSPHEGMESPQNAYQEDAYIEFEMAPTEGPVTLERFYVSMARGASIGDARGLHLRSSADDYERVLWFDEVLTERPDIERFEVPLTDVQLDETTTFRLYLNTPGSNRTIEVGDLAFDIE